ncbi:hypothetical protein Y032_0028g1655 [Ancylostoma ceylanicum]|nr:hypothetical protein Y032_0028g1655 [Ancylostoma ceylanicum]
MQVINRLVTCLVVLLCNKAAAISDDECANYHELRSLSDYGTFVEDCAGKKVLGFEAGVSNKFYASKLTQEEFNGLFANAVKVSFFIYVENTKFVELKMPKLQELVGGLSIRNNQRLKTFHINRGHKFGRTVNGPTTVTVDGNPVLNQQSYAELRYLCDYCDIFEYTKCSALDPVQPAFYAELVSKCAGERIIKQKPGARFYLKANKMTLDQFTALFAQATHVELCINFQDMQWKQIVFPKLVRLIPCGYGDPSLNIVHNLYLTAINLPVYHSEGFGRLNSMTNVVLRNNFVLPPAVLQSLKSHCRFCKLQQYKECDDLRSSSTKNATEFVDMCGGKRIFKPRKGQILILDISYLTQELIDELFMDVTYIEMCITLRSSQIRNLRMPHLREMHSCQKGRPAFIIEGNALLEFIELSPQFKFSIDEYLFVILNNPRLRQDIYIIFEQCKGCVVEYRTRCGLERGGYDSPGELLANCAGKRKIVFKYEITVNEFQFQQLCSRAVHMKMCFNIVNTNFREIRCPSLRYIEPCQPGKQVFKIIGNPLLTIIDIPITVIYPPKEKILIVKKNQRVPAKTITKLKQICPICEIEGYFSKCSGLGPITDVMAFVKMCTGQPFIDGREGVILEVDLSKLTEAQINALFAEVVEMKISITIRGSSIKHLRFPKLTKWTSGARGKPALTLVYNFELISVEFPMCRGGCISGAVIQYNPRLPKTIIDLILSWCSNCLVELYVPSCGLGVGGFSSEDFVRACAGKPFIKPEGVVVVIDSTRVSEAEFNAFCSKAVFMEVCIRIIDSNWRSIRCPHLKEIRPCAVGRPVFEIVDNQHLQILDIPLTVVFLPEVRAFVIRGNPLLPGEWLRKMRMQCPRCSIEEATGCGLAPSEYTDKQLVKACAGKTIIRPARGFFLTVTSMKVTEEELNRMCSQAVYMEICITITRSAFRSLRCPKLQQLKPCLPGQPAITIVDNPFFEILEFPTTVKYPRGALIIEIRMNPSLPPNILQKYKPWCPGCTIVQDYVCGITKPNFSTKELVAACAGKRYIKPAKGVIVVVKSSDVTEQELNMLCSKVEYMEICIEITNSQFRSLRCPHLKELRPCAPNRPAIKIVNNRYFHVLVIPPNVRYPPNVLIIEFRKNPMIDITIIEFLRKWCPGCVLTPDYACGIEKKSFTMKELVLACAGWEFIRPPPGVQIIITSDMVTEDELNRMCAKAVYMEVCIEIKNSKFKSLRCPHLKQLKSCKPGRPAITIEYNAYFDLLFIPPNVKYPPGELIIIVKRTPRLQIGNIHQLQRWCPHCSISPDYVCGISSPRFTMQQLVAACAGQKHIVPAPGVVIVVKSSSVTEEQMNAMCSKVEVMQICIEITRSMYRSLRCPHLKELRPCQPGRPAITIVDNPHFVILELPTVIVFPKGTLIIELRGNPMLSIEIILRIKKWCPECVVAGDYACGLNKPNPSTAELMAACVGRTVVVPVPKYQIVIHSRDFTEDQFNAFCSKVQIMEACITIERSKFKRLRCPHLKELRPCQKGKPALTIVENFYLEVLVIPSVIKVPAGELIFVIRDNPRISLEILLQLKRLCPGCSISLDTDCGLTRPANMQQLAAACANKLVIKPSKGHIIEFHSKYVSEAEMNAICAKVVYMEACITISASKFRRFRCPNLRELRPCAPGRAAITVVDNEYLVEFFIPIEVLVFPRGAIILEFGGNLQLSVDILEKYKKYCRGGCRFPNRNACVLQRRTYSDKELVRTCAGKSIIKPQPGFVLTVSSQHVTEAELNALCSKAIYMEICMVIKASHFKRLRCPMLKELKPCRPGQPAITIVNNLQFVEIQLLPSIRYPHGTLIFEVTGNPRLSITIIELLKKICPHCHITPDYDCGLKRPFTIGQLVSACAGKAVIRPKPGYHIEIHSKDTTEAELNAFCSQVIYLKACITIDASTFRSFKCPHLRELKPCQPGRPAIVVTNNAYLTILEIPVTVIIPTGVTIFKIYGNPLLSIEIIERFRRICPMCRFPVDNACKLEARVYSDKELVKICAGTTKIKPAKGYFLTVSSKHVTEAELNALCSKVTYMEICITITESHFKSLRCPHLKELRPCKPGRPAITIIRNFEFSILEIPSSIIVPKGVLIFEIAENPRLSVKIITILKTICPLCRITANVACDLEGRKYTDKELVRACAGKTIIKPAPGWILVLSSTQTTEEEMNALCSKAIYMEICLEITNSQFKQLRCPHLKELRPCQPGRPAIKIVNNLYFELLEIPFTVVYPRGELILEIHEVPRMPTALIKRLQAFCKSCKITANLGCGLTKRNYSDAEMVAACAGKTIIKPAEGYMLVMSSDTVSEAEMNAVCAKAVYMEICIIIRNSKFRSLKCPHLRELKSCKPGTPAIRILGNPMLTEVSISKTLLYRIGTKTLEIRGNPRLSRKSIKALNKLCPECIIRRQP